MWTDTTHCILKCDKLLLRQEKYVTVHVLPQLEMSDAQCLATLPDCVLNADRHKWHAILHIAASMYCCHHNYGVSNMSQCIKMAQRGLSTYCAAKQPNFCTKQYQSIIKMDVDAI